MRRLFLNQWFCVVTVLIALLALVACGKDNKGSGNPSKIVVSPSSLTLRQGEYNPTALGVDIIDEKGNILNTKFTPTFSVKSGGNLASVSLSGLVCAGQWDSLTTPVTCTPATGSGTAIIQASVGSVTSDDVKIYVVPPIDRVTISAAPVDLDPSGLDCISQGTTDAPNTRSYTVQASYRGSAVSLPPGSISWVTANSNIATFTAGTDTPTGVFTSVLPGQFQFYVSVGRVVSTPATFTTCPVAKISISDASNNNATSTSSPLASAATVTLTPVLTDSKGKTISLSQSVKDSSGNSTTVTQSLTWLSSQPLAASVNGTGVVTATSNGGTTAVTASCLSPNCNRDMGAVYSNIFRADVSGTTSATVFVGSATAVSDATPSAGKTIYPFTTSTGAWGTPVTLGDVPNSMMFSPNGSVLYVGTASGLITVSPTNNITTSPVTSVPGKVLTISPDSTAVVISNGSKVFLYTGSSTTTLNITGATEARFSPNGSKLYILGNGKWWVYSAGTFTASTDIAGVASAAFLTNGALGYVAHPSALNIYGGCNNVPRGSISLSSSPLLMAPLPDDKHVVAAGTTGIALVTTETNGFAGYVDPAGGCAPSATPTASEATFSGGTATTAKQLIVSPNGTKAFIISDAGKLLGASITSNNIAPLTIDLKSLVNGTAQTTSVPQTSGGILNDGSRIFLGGTDNQLHIVDLSTNTDTPKALPDNPPAGFKVDFVAVQPH